MVASDTDSIYVDFESIVDRFMKDKSDEEISIILDQFCEEKIQPVLNKAFKELAVRMNAYEQKMFMKRESICSKGIWKAKKKYILNSWNDEGVQYNEPKLKMVGIEAIRTTTPKVCRDNIKKCLSIIMNENQDKLLKFIDDFKREFLQLEFEEISFPSGINGVKEYSNFKDIYKKGTPIHVKAALFYNDLIKKHKLDSLVPITDGDKIRWCYLKTPNPIQNNAIGASDKLPIEFGLNRFIDKEKQFEKAFLEPLRQIADIIQWDVEKKSTLEGFFG